MDTEVPTPVDEVSSKHQSVVALYRVYLDCVSFMERLHHSHKLQEDWDHYGRQAFEFEVLEYIASGNLLDAERRYIDSLNALDGYNGCGCKGSTLLRDLHTGRFGQTGPELLAKRPLCVRLPVGLDKALRAMPNRAEWMRQAIMDAAIAQGLWDGL